MRGRCTFCGALVVMTFTDGFTNAHDPAAPPHPAEAAGTSAQHEPTTSADATSSVRVGQPAADRTARADAELTHADASAAEAVALKDRLVEYGRTSAQRTVVLDDQSDFFEIDSNAWLTDEVGGTRLRGLRIAQYWCNCR